MITFVFIKITRMNKEKISGAQLAVFITFIEFPMMSHNPFVSPCSTPPF